MLHATSTVLKDQGRRAEADMHARELERQDRLERDEADRQEREAGWQECVLIVKPSGSVS